MRVVVTRQGTRYKPGTGMQFESTAASEADILETNGSPGLSCANRSSWRSLTIADGMIEFRKNVTHLENSTWKTAPGKQTTGKQQRKTAAKHSSKTAA
jgi:hypothetical protein